MTQSSSRSGNRLLLILTGAAVAAAAGYCFYMNSPGLGQPRQKESAAVFGGWTYDREDQHLAAAALVKAGLTDYTWEDVSGFSDADMERNERLLKEVAHIIIELSQEGGFDNASGF